MFYEMTIAGCKRQLPLCPLNEDLHIAGFIMFGDVEITQRAAEELLKQAPEFDVIVTAESKGIPLAYEMARQAGTNEYIVCRKEQKLYMPDAISTKVMSISTDHVQTLVLSRHDASRIKDKRVLIVDDVISTGGSVKSIETLIKQVGGQVVGRMTVLAEGDASKRDDIIYLEHLPLFRGDGAPIE